MAKKTSKPSPSKQPAAAPKRAASSAAGTTSSGPSHPGAADTAMAKHAAEQQTLVASMPSNGAKPHEYGYQNAVTPLAGPHTEPSSATTGAGTLSEKNATDKTQAPALEPAAMGGGLAAKRVNDAGQTLTTNQGVALSDNQSSLKAGLRGPTLLEAFILREKITHFDHERIPERIVHARGSGAHGFFEASLPHLEIERLTQAG